MTTKTVYLFDEATRAYIGTYEAQESPEEPGVFIVPVCSTDAPAPSLKSGEKAILQPDNTTWLIETETETETIETDPVIVSVEEKIDTLWRAADDVVSGSISGVALSILSIGVIQSKPKALAVAAWSKAIWTEYYARKALVTTTSTDNMDFSSFGSMPYTVPELQEEINI